MEPLNQKFLERVLSRKALQFGNSFPCQICVAGFLCGVCLTIIFLVALTSLGVLYYTVLKGLNFLATNEIKSLIESKRGVLSDPSL